MTSRCGRVGTIMSIALYKISMKADHTSSTCWSKREGEEREREGKRGGGRAVFRGLRDKNPEMMA